MTEEFLRITFDGPSITYGTIDARILGSSLVNLSDAITSAHAAIRADAIPSPNIQIRETGEGSFWVDLLVVVESGAVQSVVDSLSGKYATAAANLGGIVGLTVASMSFLKFRKGRKVKRTERFPAPDAQPDLTKGTTPTEYVKVEFVDGTIATIPAAVWTASESANFQKAARDTVRAAASPDINYIKLQHIGSTYADNEELTVTDQDIGSFDLPESEEPTETISTYNALVNPTTINFEKGKKWRLREGDRSFLAKIEDEDFARELDNGRIHIGKHDSFRVTLRETITAHVSARPKTTISVLKVLEQGLPPVLLTP